MAEERHPRDRAACRRSRATTASRGSICASVNEEVVHGIPGRACCDDGDLLSIDIGTTLDGYVSDTAVTVGSRNDFGRTPSGCSTSPRSA